MAPFHRVATQTDTGFEYRSIAEHPKAVPMMAGTNIVKNITIPSTSTSAWDPTLSAAAPLKKNNVASVDHTPRI